MSASPSGAPSAWAGWAAARHDMLQAQGRRRPPPPPGPARLNGPMDVARQLDMRSMPPPQLDMYMLRRVGHVIRFEGSLGRKGQKLEFSTVPAALLRYLPPDPTKQWVLGETAEPAHGVSGDDPGGVSAASLWWAAGRVLPSSLVLLALLAVTIRAADRVLHSGLFKRQDSVRRNSDEWAQPNVFATRYRPRLQTVLPSAPPAEAIGLSGPDITVDLPPAYYDIEDVLEATREDLPPSYADYAAYYNPQDSPSVHICIDQRLNQRFDSDTPPDPSRDSPPDGPTTRFVFANGRVVEEAGNGNDVIPDDAVGEGSVNNNDEHGDLNV